MSVRLNHIIVWCRDNERSAAFFVDLLVLRPPTRFGPYCVVELSNGVSLDFHSVDGPISSQRYAFLVDEEDFDFTFARIRARGLDYWASPGKRRRGEINDNDGGRGLYVEDPDGHFIEVITRPYFSGGKRPSMP